jgi:hypothetical protein
LKEPEAMLTCSNRQYGVFRLFILPYAPCTLPFSLSAMSFYTLHPLPHTHVFPNLQLEETNYKSQAPNPKQYLILKYQIEPRNPHLAMIFFVLLPFPYQL